ncbi:MAG: signal recognition particle-docking protein FtsY [Nitrospinae bacterium]|nr:signal recognition particle-docking protein FtsY [Nitrospinota bacterium]
MNEPTRENPPEEKSGFFQSLKQGLSKTRNSLTGGIDNLIHGKAQLGPELVDEVEEALLLADVGVPTTQRIIDELNRQIEEARIRDREGMLDHLRQMMIRLLETHQKEWDDSAHSPFVVLVVGVNGSGKTTTIGKLAQRWHNEGKKVMLTAGDTFRAAAVEQLQMWADRIGIACVRHNSGADPSAVAFDGVQAAVARKMDIVIVDTAGRLQTNLNLMEELKKVKRVIGKVLPDAPHETLLVLDATIGQNSISQARQFHEALKIDGLVMTKLDGTSRGGVLINISQELNLPVRFIGIGEKAEDLQEFKAELFVRALFED